MSLKDGININFSDSSYQKTFCRLEWAPQNLDYTLYIGMRHPLSFSLSLCVCLSVCMYVRLSIFLCDKVLTRSIYLFVRTNVMFVRANLNSSEQNTYPPEQIANSSEQITYPSKQTINASEQIITYSSTNNLFVWTDYDCL